MNCRTALLVAVSCVCAAGQSSQQGMGSGAKAMPRSSRRLAGVAPPAIAFRDVAAEWGVTAANSYGGVARKKTILEMTGNGVGLVDFDNDGKLDILLVNAERPSVLLRNQGGGRFADVTRDSGLATSGWAQGVCAADYDNDGFTDLLITRYGSNQVWRNEKGRFRDVTAAAGLTTPGEYFHTGCTFSDFDRDGLADLFVSNYVAFSLKAQTPLKSPLCNWRGLDVFCGPRGFGTGVNHLFKNLGGGRFRDVSAASGVRVDGLHYGLGTVAADFDDDGWPDIYVACDSSPSMLLHNQRNGTFKDAAVSAGVAYGEHGEEQGGMGVGVFDYDNDGRLDIVRTNFIDETTTLYRNEGELFFADATVVSGLGVNTNFVSWGVAAVDLDRDGNRDMVIANGHIYPELATAKTPERFEQPRLVYWNAGNGAFADASTGGGEAVAAARCSRGLAAGDLDDDGSPEIVIVNQNGAPSVLRVTPPTPGNWVRVALRATRSNRSAIGARVRVNAGGKWQVAEVQSGGSYLSQSDFRLHFGLGRATRVDRIEVMWPSGEKTAMADAAANTTIAITEPGR